MEWIKSCNEKLAVWKKLTFGSVQRRTREAQQRINQLKHLDPLYFWPADHKLVRNEVLKWMEQEKMMWRQRSRVLWLSARDQNTHYFHNKASQQKKTNHIAKIQNSARKWVVGEDCDQVITSYFNQIFTSSSVGTKWAFLDQRNGRINEDMLKTLKAQFTWDEVNSAIKQMHPNMALGPDEMAPILFHKY